MKKMKEQIEAKDEDALKRYCQLPISSPFFDADYGGSPYGVFTAAMPTEYLHALDNGIIEKSLQVLWKAYISSNKLQSKIDALIKSWSKYPKQRGMHAGSMHDYPRLLWKDGISTLTRVSAADKAAMMFTIVMLSLTSDGSKLFTDSRSALCDDRLESMRYCFQQLLCYRQWLKKSKYWKRGDRKAQMDANASIRTMLSQLIELWPRLEGKDWAIPKLHMQTHVPFNIEYFGPPSSFLTQVTEAQHKTAMARMPKVCGEWTRGRDDGRPLPQPTSSQRG